MTTTNRLAGETSPYLRQHAGNPVDWYPWGEEAFAAARQRDVPILLSVGYSACHWCHVMAHESFEDDEVAATMNSSFVNVKVDREERPDVDAVYMEAVQAVTGGGGWPMTVFLTPDGRPFHGGTYYPKGQFLELLGRVAELWRDRRAELEDAAGHLAEMVRAGTALPRPPGTPPAGPAEGLLGSAASALLARHDPEWGGFGRAPKFPQPPLLECLLLAAAHSGREDLMGAFTTTLDAMASGGIYDHLGGGFARYSTDRRWLVPHFEKMLYDNALLARAYLHGWQATGAPRWKQVVEETLGYLLRPPMRLPGGGFASAEDADSEGVEGKFYVWDLSEVLEVGGAETAEWYGVTGSGNWEGRNILFRPVRGELIRPPEVEEGRAALFARRESRVRPGLDDKVLTEWNAMAVAALAEAGAAMGIPTWVSAAEETASFLLSSLRRPDGRWLRSWQSGSARHLAYGADHAWLVEAFTRLYEATGRRRWLDEALDAAEALIGSFWTGEAFNTTAGDAEALIASPVDTQDGALPSTNSVAAAALLRLGALTGDTGYTERATRVVESLTPAMTAAPLAFTGLVAAAHLAATGLAEVVVAGDRPDLVAVAARHYLPRAVLAWGEPFPSPLWEGRGEAPPGGVAHVCENYACRSPVSDASGLAAQLGSIHP
ncbi:MAG TPA: thioredoxin domain-containing protein [Acidimicrobiales bacterium]|nr:thioredoxin domain-containing protein [Acidimicrobiales bacterium]